MQWVGWVGGGGPRARARAWERIDIDISISFFFVMDASRCRGCPSERQITSKSGMTVKSAARWSWTPLLRSMTTRHHTRGTMSLLCARGMHVSDSPTISPRCHTASVPPPSGVTGACNHARLKEEGSVHS